MYVRVLEIGFSFYCNFLLKLQPFSEQKVIFNKVLLKIRVKRCKRERSVN